ncbi:MAG: bifunctional tRNA (5-methylaminomethyl-2-thiouridine)(34)-methyltransferase MnmD/FAD-dependent 5-carboxymethylaminomethyl-2-thiouridine(34) oxidoreductase MnmC [Zoogloeaceae bacterium]|jgi:tRNA 5-methylaminomethyl-2-thiouridine biosynthesis bifunctional protein|nr:bifunctional tRNA (5-methylaminomethyl-2-thiouridine)(34)-methyltransferase MnmD/FAD-dependent 5-carboxymethylaminomethyl-2-thiouridine(34) oxidoreductase MnmC [Zoogloeaceae bacterium]
MSAAPLCPARLTLNAEGVPYSETYRDVYHARQGGAAQARHVFLAGNGLPERWRTQRLFVILETGFGLGLNFLVTWAAWKKAGAPCSLHFVTLEAHPFSAADLAKAHSAILEHNEELTALAASLRENWPMLTPGLHRVALESGRLTLTLAFGDARQTLRRLVLAADALYLDGFSPAKNPELWSKDICRGLARAAAPGATLATWTVAGAVREALAAVEFDLEKRPGFAGKREMLVGRYRSRKPQRFLEVARARQKVLVIGAGVAGSSAAFALARRGWQVTVLEARAAPGEGASGNLAGMMRPLPSADDNPLARLTRAGFFAAIRHLKTLEALGAPARWNTTGVLHVARDSAQEAAQQKIERLQFPPEFARYVDKETARAILGWPVLRGGWFFPHGGWVSPPTLCRANLAAFAENVRLRTHAPVAALNFLETSEGALWQALDAHGGIMADAPFLLMASGVAATRFSPFAFLPQRAARGQVTWLPARELPALHCLVCGSSGYLVPPVDGIQVAGASFHLEEETEAGYALRAEDARENLGKLAALLPGFAPENWQTRAFPGRAGFRPTSLDRLPMAGALPLSGKTARTRTSSRYPPSWPGLFCLLGYGSRGIVWSALMAEFLASRMNGEPLPLEYDLAAAIAPERFMRGAN